MEKSPEDAVLLAALTFFEKEPESVETTVFVSRLMQHLALNLESLYSDEDVTDGELKDCISQLKQLLSTFETHATDHNVAGIGDLLKELGISETNHNDDDEYEFEYEYEAEDED